ncbi:MAG: MucB/RseB C-terminal domain-containing protein [Pseudomonadota bacterium]
MSRCGPIFALVLAGLGPSIEAADTPLDWFTHMDDAVRSLNYRGDLIHAHDGDVDSLEVVHALRDGVEHERVTTLNGAAQESIRRGDEFEVTTPRSTALPPDLLTMGNPLVAMLPEYRDVLAEHYEFRHRPDSGQVAGRRVHTLTMAARDEFRYGYRFQYDVETGLPLKYELIDRAGRSLETVMFSRIEVNSPLDAEAFRSRLTQSGREGFRTIRLARPSAGDSGVAVSESEARFGVERLPAGFYLTVVTRHDNMPGGAEHLVYTDGMASISVFAEQHAQKRETMSGLLSMGVANAFGVRLGEYQITVIGEVPAATVERVGQSIKPRP